MGVLHQNDGVGIVWLRNIDDLSCLACVHTLKYSDAFTDFKELFKLATLDLNWDRDFFLGLKSDKACFTVDRLDDALTALELPCMDFASITDLHSQLTVITDCL